MSDLVYTQFGYGKIEAPSQPKSPEAVAQKDQAQPQPAELIKEAIEPPKEENTQEVPPEKMVKVALKWGGTGYLPVVSQSNPRKAASRGRSNSK